MKKQRQDILRKNKVHRRRLQWVDVVVALCLLSDFFSVFLYSSTLFNEWAWISILVSIVTAICLDMSLFHAAKLLNSPRSQSADVRRRCFLNVAAMVAVFLLGFACLVHMAWAVETVQGNNLWQDGTLARLLLPIATSGLSFVMGLKVNPSRERLEEIGELRRELQLAIADERVDCDRVQRLLQRFDPDQYDAQLRRQSVLRLKAAASAAEYEIRLQLSQELGSTEAVDAFLCSNDLLLNPSELLDELAEVDAAAPAAGAESPATPGSGLVRLVSGS